VKPTSAHPSDESLAELALGRLDEITARHVEEHLARCPECFAAYADAVRFEVASKPEENLLSEEDRRLAHGIAAAPRALRPAVVPRRSPLRWAVPLAMATLAVVGVLGWWNRRHPEPVIDSRDPVQVAIGESSARGMVLPGGESWADRSLPDYRGSSPGPESADDSLVDAALRSLQENGLADDAVRALSGYVAEGRLRVAQTFASSARRRFPRDDRLALLEGVIAYRQGDLARAEQTLQSILARSPRNALARLDLAILLRERDPATARPHLERVIREESGSPLARRAERLLR
jgi:hypothetical protein